MLSLKLFFAGNLMLAGIEIGSSTVFFSFLGTCVAVGLGIFLYKKNLATKRQDLIEKYSNTANDEPASLRKYEEVGVFKFAGLGTRIGGVAALLISFLAINYTTYTKEVIYETPVYDMPVLEAGTVLEPPSTPAAPPPPPPAAPPPPPPPPPPTTAFKVTDEKVDEVIVKKDIEDDKVKLYDPNAKPGGVYGDGYSTGGVPGGTGSASVPAGPPPPPPPPPPAPTKEIFEVVEQMPRFPGCEDVAGDDNAKKACADQKMMQWIYSQIKYPSQAREMGIEGTAVISFVVNEQGEIANAEVRKKVGGGCEEEALRVIKEMAKMTDKWTPGKQRGKAVAVRYTLPVRFKLK